MFYVKSFVHKINLSPQYLSPNIHEMVQEYLSSKVEGSCTSSGYVISVLKIGNISQGLILLTGEICFTVKYHALILKPVKGEVLDANIVSFTKMGYFAAVGPLSIFLSNYQIPQGMLEDLEKNTTVRLKIIGTKIDNTKMYAIGTLNDDCLGVIS